MALVIRKATLKDKKKIFNFLHEAYGSESFFKFPDRWMWLFEKNPFTPHKPCVWIAVLKGKIVGQFCGMHVLFKFGNQVHRSIWSLDSMVLARYRASFLRVGQRTLQGLANAHSITLGLWATDAALRLFLKEGAQILSHISNFEKKVKKSPLKAISSRLEIVPISKFDQRIEKLWSKVSQNYYGYVQRTAKYLNWKYFEQPHTHYQAFGIHDPSNTIMRGCVVLRKGHSPEQKIGLIADLIVMPHERVAIESLLHFSIQFFKENGMKSVQMATTVEAYKRCLLNLNFREKNKISFFVLSKNTKKSELSNHLGKKFFLSRGDSDWDQYPYLR